MKEYLVDLNGTAAAIRAGFSERSAGFYGSTLLSYPNVRAAILRARQKLIDKAEISAERVLRELSLLAFSNMQDYMVLQEDGTLVPDFSRMTRDQAAAIQELTVDVYTEKDGEDFRAVKRTKFKLADKRAALVDLGRHLGIFVEPKAGDNITVNNWLMLINTFGKEDGATTQRPVIEGSANS